MVKFDDVKIDLLKDDDYILLDDTIFDDFDKFSQIIHSNKGVSFMTYDFEIVKFIKSINDEIQIIQNTKSIIYPYELDIYLPDYNLAIEYNSSYFHNKDNQIREKYKTELCKEKGIELIHIWEDEFENFKEKLIKNFKNLRC